MIKSLWVKGVRNLEEAVFSFSPGEPTVILGENNQGKTNFLEALYVLCHGRSPFGQDLLPLVSVSQQKAVLGGDVVRPDGDLSRIYHQFDKDGGRFFSVDDKPFKRGSVLSSYVLCSFLSADVVRLFQDSADVRRREMDMFCKEVFSEYGAILRRYTQALRQKNRLLKQERSFEDVSVWNQQLSVLAADIVAYRCEGLSILETEMGPLVETVFGDLASSCRLPYICSRLPNPFLGDKLTYQTALLSAFSADFEKERILGYTLSGPHRDDFSVYLDEQLLFTCFSRGVNRMMAILLRWGELFLFRQYRKMLPVLLLDDVFAECDFLRKQRLITLLSGRVQCMYTSVLEQDVDLFDQANVFRMQRGAALQWTMSPG